VGEGEGELRESSERVELAIWNDERKLKTMAITKVEVDAVCAVVALMPDLQTSESLRKTTREEKTCTCQWHNIKVRTPLTQSYDQDDLELQKF
jgi:UDP-N-acetyl-D-mannosaminuronate dehydrogenase